MSEVLKPSSVRFMAELDAWTEAEVIDALGAEIDRSLWAEEIVRVKRVIRAKVLESYRNGQSAGPKLTRQRKGSARR